MSIWDTRFLRREAEPAGIWSTRFGRRGVAFDGHANPDQWITVHPNDEEKGHHVLIDGDTGGVKAGMGGKFKGVHIGGVPGYRGQAGEKTLAPVYRPEEPKEPESPKKPERTVAKGKTARPDFNQAKESGMKGLYITRPQPSSRECFDKYLEETKDEPLARQYLAITKEIDDTIALQGLSSIAESKDLGKKLVGLRLKK